MFTCLEPHKSAHQHATVTEAKICWGLVPIPPAPAPEWTSPKDRPGSITPRQVQYLKSLGATRNELYTPEGMPLSINQASALIDKLKAEERNVAKMNDETDPRIRMVSGMLDGIPDGYYAVRPDSTVNYTFIRISRPKSGRLKGCIKVQTQHSDDLILRAVRYGSGRLALNTNTIVESLMLLVVGHQSAAMVYGQEIGKCCRCNKALTDDRSRHYGIGPDCEQVWTWVIDLVDERVGHAYRGVR